MTQQLYKDPHGLEAWDHSVSSRCVVTLVDAVQWYEITGKAPPTQPPPPTIPLIALGPGKAPYAKMRRVREGET